MKYVAFICFYITMNVICYGGYSMSTILFFIFIDSTYILFITAMLPILIPPFCPATRLGRPGALAGQAGPAGRV